MRKEAKKTLALDRAHIQDYHTITSYHDNYAFSGFTGNWYFNSDRKLELVKLDDGTFARKDGQPLKGYGLEIEVECNGIRKRKVLSEVMEKVVFPNFKFGKDMFKMQADGSLGGATSVEVITQVMTKGRIRNDYTAYQAMYDTYFTDFGISADSYSTHCGMHVNVSNAVFGKTEQEQTDAIRKLYYLVNRYYRFFCMLFYRSPDRTEWCGRMNYGNARDLDLYHMSSSHGNCMNLSHFPEGRIEIRLVGGQNRYYTFRNTMECIFFLTENVRKLKWEDLEDLTKVFKGCNNYVVKRLSDCLGYDGFTTDMYNTIKNTAKFEDLEIRLF